MRLWDGYTRVAAVALPAVVAALLYIVWDEASTRTQTHAGSTKSASEAFGEIYEHAKWGRRDGGAGTSGSGSTLEATVAYRAYLQAFMKEHDIHSVVDAGCGDWEFSHTIDWSGVDYKGYDVVPAVVEQDDKKYGAPHVAFFVADIIESELPPADLLLCKNVLQHLTNADVSKFLTKLGRYKHVLLTDGVDPKTLTSDNPDIARGDYRPLDVTRPPFSVRGKKVLMYLVGTNMHQVVYVGAP